MGEGIELLSNAHHGPARKPAISPSSQLGTSRDIPNILPRHHTADGISNGLSTANQCTKLGVPAWLERASTASWNRLLN